MYEIYCKLRDKKGYKDSDVARITGITKSTFSDWKSGRSCPKNDKLQKIAETLGVTVDYLMTGNTGDDSKHYYANEETREIAQEIFENPDLRSLFHAARDLTPERLKAHIDFMQSLKQQEEKHNDEGC